MNHAVLAICDEELDYAAHLADYLGRKEGRFSETRVFTNEKSLADFLAKHNIDLLLIGESIFQKRKEWENARQIVLLSEGGALAEELAKEQASIYKFQSAENIFRELNDIYALQEKPHRKVPGTGGESRVFGVFSPCGGSRKTIFAMALGELLAKKKKVLYINLECFSGLGRQIFENSMEGMSELIYYIHEKNLALSQKIQSMICRMGAVDTIPPVNHFRDLMEIEEDDVDAVMGELKASGIYDYVIIDLGYFHFSTFQWLFWCDSVFLTGGEDRISMEKKKTMRHYMQMEGKEILLERFYDIRIPKVRNLSEEDLLEAEENDSLEEFSARIQSQVTAHER